MPELKKEEEVGTITHLESRGRLLVFLRYSGTIKHYVVLLLVLYLPTLRLQVHLCAKCEVDSITIITVAIGAITFHLKNWAIIIYSQYL
jgi:hypothetical protein